MKLKNHDWIEAERRLGAADSQLVQEDRTIRTALLALAVFGGFCRKLGFYLFILASSRCPATVESTA